MALELQTERLTLRPLAPGDFEAYAAMMTDPRVARFLALGGLVPSRETMWRSFATILGHWQIRGYGFFAVIERDSGTWVGRVGPLMPEGWPGLEAGWGIDARWWGKGYAPEAAIAAIRWTFAANPDLPRILSLIDPANENSRAVARKIGETLSGEKFQHEAAGPLDIWAAPRDEWLARFG
jgi:RimJ/RimL family protein N-acetyltransferase